MLLRSFLFVLQLERLQQQIRDVKKDHRKEKEKIIEDFSNQINKLDDDLKEKTREVDLMQSELKMVKEFRRKRGQMQKELDEVQKARKCLILVLGYFRNGRHRVSFINQYTCNFRSRDPDKMGICG